MWWIALLACAAPANRAAPAVAAPRGVEPLVEAPAQPWGPPQAPLADHVAALEAALALGMPNPVSLTDLYAMVIDHADETCPFWEVPEEGDQAEVWSGGCVTAAGYGFEGLSIQTDLREEGEEELRSHEIESLASFRLTDPTGAVLTNGGEYLLHLEGDEEGRAFRASVGGLWSYPGQPGWLGAGVELGLVVEGEGAGADMAFTLNGGVAWPGVSLSFREATVDTEVCDGLIQGRVDLRDDGGHWFRLDFDDCAPCAAASWDGELVGEACVSAPLSALLLSMGAEIQR